MSFLMNTYNRLPIAFSHGVGCRLTDTAGKTYLDGLAGIAVNTLGHAHPKLVKAIAEQSARLMHVSNLFQIPEAERLAERLAALAKMDEVFLCNSGCEANEAAIKLARLYGHQRGIENPAVIVMEKAFHGRTLATLSATGNRKVQAGFEPLVSGFVRVPFGNIAAIEQVALHNPNVVAVLLEPIQGEGGIRAATIDFLQKVRTVCDQNNWLLMLDEVQSGVGRTGRWFAHQHAAIRPDVMTLAKGLASGVPIGACLAAGSAAGVFKPGNHGSTFGGNPLACVAALTTLEVMEEDALLARASSVGERIRAGLKDGLKQSRGVVEVRGQGLMIGVELDRPCGELVKLALAAGLVINVTADNVIRLLPPLVMTDAEADELVTLLVSVTSQFLACDTSPKAASTS
ncbi:MAG: acetylornithine transaminase [Rhodocyclaceae bacterium]|nr:acetylornithine transaminase [Rhodocyclaceae bacterium]MBP6110118.1 acetylornithine transaminase [Rhodocyclaceae bacterium]